MPLASGTVVPDSKVTGPSGNRAAPVQFFQGRRGHAEAAHADPGPDEFRADLLRLVHGQRCGHRGPGRLRDQAEPLQHRGGRRRVAGVHPDPGQIR
jgi:hypothetical protein